MNNDEVEHVHEHVDKPWYSSELFFFIAGSLVVSLVLVAVSMFIYVASGASLLDSSRPGYLSVQKDISDTTFKGFPSTGDVNQDTLDDFNKLYQKQIKSVMGDDVFSGAALSDQALGIDISNE